MLDAENVRQVWRIRQCLLAEVVALDGLASILLRTEASESGRDGLTKSVWKFRATSPKLDLQAQLFVQDQDTTEAIVCARDLEETVSC